MIDSSDEIDLVSLFKKILKQKKIILKVTLISFLVGIVYALSLPNMYTSSTTFIPQLSSGVNSGTSSLTGLASLAGISLGSNNTGGEFPATLYPQVIEGPKFKLDLLSSRIYSGAGDLTIREYYKKYLESSSSIFNLIKKYTIELPSTIKSILSDSKNSTSDNAYSDSSIINISNEDKEYFKLLSKNISISVNQKEGFITLSSTDQNKNISAQIAYTAQNLLQEQIISFKNQSSKEVLDFSLKQFEEKKILYEKLQDQTAIFNDKNQNIASSLFQNKLSRLQNELNISQSIVQQLASQVEQAKLQVNKDTPVFTIIKPVTVPMERSFPNRRFYVIIFTFCGFILSIAYVLSRKSIHDFISILKS